MSNGTLTNLLDLFKLSDEQAMWRVQHFDDHRAFAQLVERWRDPIFSLCTRMTGDSHRAEDLTQEAFVRIFEKRRDYKASARFSTYLWRVALNLCYDELRRRRRRPESSLDDPDNPLFGVSEFSAIDEPGPDTQLVAKEEGALVRQALLRMPEAYRTVLVLRHYERLKIREIAEVLEIPEGTVNSRMAEALCQLTRILEPQFASALQPSRDRTNHRKESLVL